MNTFRIALLICFALISCQKGVVKPSSMVMNNPSNLNNQWRFPKIDSIPSPWFNPYVNDSLSWSNKLHSVKRDTTFIVNEKYPILNYQPQFHGDQLGNNQINVSEYSAIRVD